MDMLLPGILYCELSFRDFLKAVLLCRLCAAGLLTIAPVHPALLLSLIR